MTPGARTPIREDAAAPPHGDLSHAWRALRHRNFRLFFGGQSISLIGTWMTRVAISWLVYRLTKSALLLGLVGFAGQIPTFLLAPLAGVIVDRIDRRQVLIWTQALAMVQSLLLAWLTLSHRINIWEVLALSAMQGVINAFDMPGRQSFMIRMVEDRADLSNAIAINSSMVNVARLVGPSLAGMLIARHQRGLVLPDRRHQLHCGHRLAADDAHSARCGGARNHHHGRPTARGLDVCSLFRPHSHHPAAVCAAQPDGWPFMVLMPVFAAQVLHAVRTPWDS